MLNKKLSILFLFTFTIQSFLLFPDTSTLNNNDTQSNTQTKNIYHSIEKLFMPSIIKPENNSDKIIIEEDKKNKNKIEIPKLTDYECYKLIFELQQKYSKSLSNNISNETLAKDLCLFNSSETTKDNSIFHFIDKTETKFGRIKLAKILFNPTTNITLLKKRQDIIHTLLNNETLFENINQNLKIIKLYENDFLSFWKPFDKMFENFLKNLIYFKLPGFNQLNTSPTALGTALSFQLITGSIMALTAPLLCPGFFISATNNFGENYYGNSSLAAAFKIDKPAIQLPAAALGFGFGLFLSREMYNTIIKSILDASNNIQQRMINTSRYIQAIKNINNLIINDTKLLLLLPEATNIKLNLEKNNQNKKLLNILNKNTFKADSPSLISHKGNIFASFELIKNLKANFLKNYKLIAKIDSYISITKLFKEHISNENARYCFVTYRENALKPFLKIENFWHPILNPKTVVTNNLELGISNSKILVTGPNAAGKSTILKAITASTLMAQTIGIAPANVMAFTPFTILNTYLNITDATGDKSLFQAEMDRALKLLQSILNLKEQQFAFFIMDEIFTGTNPEEGSAAAYGIARKLADFDNTLYLLSTHFKDLTNLENDTNHEIINYMVSAIKKSDGSFYYPYDFKEGISYSKIALDLIKNEGFDPDILTYAYQRLSVN